jgi:hypothetical protein
LYWPLSYRKAICGKDKGEKGRGKQCKLPHDIPITDHTDPDVVSKHETSHDSMSQLWYSWLGLWVKSADVCMY